MVHLKSDKEVVVHNSLAQSFLTTCVMSLQNFCNTVVLSTLKIVSQHLIRFFLLGRR